jgi:hypothetical protein
MGKQNDEPFIGLREALEKVKRDYPEAPLFALREAVATGKIPSRRSSRKARARYYVQWSALTGWYLQNAA